MEVHAFVVANYPSQGRTVKNMYAQKTVPMRLAASSISSMIMISQSCSRSTADGESALMRRRRHATVDERHRAFAGHQMGLSRQLMEIAENIEKSSRELVAVNAKVSTKRAELQALLRFEQQCMAADQQYRKAMNEIVIEAGSAGIEARATVVPAAQVSLSTSRK